MKNGKILTFPAIAKLSNRQQDAIPILMQSPSIAAAAQRTGVRERTLFRWLQDENFQAGYREARYVVMNEALAVLQRSCREAADTVLEVMRDGEASPNTRLTAAQSVIDMAMRSRTIDELEARIAALERAYTAEAFESA